MTEPTILDKTYDPRRVEPEMYARWEQSGAFASVPDGRPRERTFTIVIPPPNVTGALHLGHALNNTLQDILVRYHRMRGFNTLWQSGTDHAGIATQAVVERRIREEEGKSRHDLGREELVRRIWQWKDEYEQRIISQLKLMGCSCDWERNRFTLDEGLARAVRHQFFNMFKDGLIFRGKRLVNWDTQLQTAVADDEVYYERVKGHFYHFKYPAIEPKPGEPAHVIIATTRPETMLGDTAVAVHPDPGRFFDEQENRRRGELLNASGKDRTELEEKLKTLAERRATHLDTLIRLRDMAVDGRKLMLPLVDRVIPLILDEWADPTLGSGCVKITPAHDPNDYEVGVRHHLPMISVLTPDGRVAPIIEADGRKNPNSGKYEGLSFSDEGREKVVEDLQNLELVENIEDREHEIGHSDRSKLPIEPYLSDQWFVRTSEPPTSVGADAPATKNSGRPDSAERAADFRRRSPDLSAGAVLITWTTYGTWLPRDERGFVSRVPSSEPLHPIHNLPGEEYDVDDPRALASATERLEGAPIYLQQEHAAAALTSVAQVCGRHGIEPLAIAVMANHIHILCQTERPKDELLKLFKGNVSHFLRARFELKGAQRWFTKGGSVRYSKSRQDLTAAMEYVKNQKHPLASWSFDLGGAEFDAAFNAGMEDSEQGTSARTEVRGSLGLARSAMDAVTSGRIKVFPERYAKSYLDWLGEKRDWCISRQLWWGHRIPVWYFFWEGPYSDTTSNSQVVRLDLQYLNTEQQGKVAPQVFPGRVGNRILVGFAVAPGNPDIEAALEAHGSSQDPHVLDTRFSSALWPFSTLGWPEETPHLKQYYPGSVLCTSRDIITNWVARMVMFGLYSMGEVPFDHVYIHPKILDGRGETMSKSKGNGVDPVDVIHTHGADALRYTMADMCTETQDIRMPVEYVCPHCGKLTDQALALQAEEQSRKSRGQKLERRLQPADCKRVKCANKECGKEFATQWADAALKLELGLARETSDKFDMGRNFCNKLWNAARFAFMNLEGTPCDVVEYKNLPPEDRWILTRLSQTIRRFHECIENYQFSAAIKELRDFFWDSLCDWYVELIKPRLETGDSKLETGKNAAQQVLAFCLDQTLRLFHPTIPFITEYLWKELNHLVPVRGLPPTITLGTDRALILSDFPPIEGYPAFEDGRILALFSNLQDATRGVRDLRLQCNVPPKQQVKVTAVVPPDQADAFASQAHIVRHMANAAELTVATKGHRPKNAGSVTLTGVRIFVHDISNDEAERARATKALGDLQQQLAGKEARLNNAKFVANAKPEVVEAERERLRELTAQRQALETHLRELG